MTEEKYIGIEYQKVLYEKENFQEKILNLCFEAIDEGLLKGNYNQVLSALEWVLHGIQDDQFKKMVKEKLIEIGCEAVSK